MILIKILVEDDDQLDQICEVLEEAERNGDLPFSFNVSSAPFNPDQQMLPL